MNAGVYILVWGCSLMKIGHSANIVGRLTDLNAQARRASLDPLVLVAVIPDACHHVEHRLHLRHAANPGAPLAREMGLPCPTEWFPISDVVWDFYVSPHVHIIDEGVLVP